MPGLLSYHKADLVRYRHIIWIIYSKKYCSERRILSCLRLVGLIFLGGNIVIIIVFLAASVRNLLE